VILSVINNKGGVAKTTTAVNLAAALAGDGQRALLIDLDAQGSASLALGIPRGELDPSMSAVLFDGSPLETIIRATSVSGLDIAPGSMALANADLALANMLARERRLSDALGDARKRYDVVIIDAPPSLSLLSVNALVASDGIIVPVVPEYLALEGLVNVLQAIDLIRETMRVPAKLLGILLTRVDYRTNAAREIVGMVRTQFAGDVFKAEVRVNVSLSEAPSFGRSIFDYAPNSSGADAYRAVAEEVTFRSRRVQPSRRPGGRKSSRPKSR
jgi:chromosome partitioning protein